MIGPVGTTARINDRRRVCFVWRDGDAFDVASAFPRVAPNEIVLRKRRVSADTALRFARSLDTTPQSWLGLQTDFDVDVPSDELRDRIDREVRAPTVRR